MDHPADSSDEEGPDTNTHLLHVASLKMNGTKDRQNAVKVMKGGRSQKFGNGTLHCQLDTGAYASVINTMEF